MSWHRRLPYAGHGMLRLASDALVERAVPALPHVVGREPQGPASGHAADGCGPNDVVYFNG